MSKAYFGILARQGGVGATEAGRLNHLLLNWRRATQMHNHEEYNHKDDGQSNSNCYGNTSDIRLSVGSVALGHGVWDRHG